MYKESIQSIDLAVKNDYPKDKLKKLDERKNNCINKLKDEAGKAIENKEGRKQGFVENCIEIDWLNSDLKELGVKAKRSLNKGEIILDESPFVNSLHKDNYNDYCYTCFKKLTFAILIPCRNCIQVNYCSLKCEKESWTKFHKIECGFIDLYQINELLEHHTKICSKLFCNLFIESNLNKENLIKRIKDSTKKSGRKLESNYESFVQLIEHHKQDKNNYSLISLLLLAFFNVRFKAESKSLFKSFFSEDELILIKLTVEKHIRQIQVNALMITDTDVKSRSTISSKDTLINRLPVFESINVGIGIYINLSLINHDCNPNLSISGFNNQRVLIKTNRKVQKYSWLCFSYGAHHMYQTLSKRKKLLFDTYFFDCQCEACVNGLEPFSNMIICFHCKAEIYSSKQEYCNLCSTKIVRSEIEKLTKEVNKKVNQIEKSLKEKDLNYEILNNFIIELLQNEKKLESFLHSSNKTLERIYFVLFACYRRLNDYQKLYEAASSYWRCLLTKLDYFDLMSFNNLINFSNYLIKSIEEMINFDFSLKPIAILIQVLIHELICKLRKTIEQVYDYELEKKNKILTVINETEKSLENFLGTDPKIND